MTQPDPRARELLEAFDTWLRARRLEELVTRDELRGVLRELRADDAFWEQARPRFEKVWSRWEDRLRREERPLRAMLSEDARRRLLDGIEAFEPDHEAVRTFLRSPAVEAMLGDVLYNGITEFLRRADLLGRVINRLPVLGGIRKRVMAAFQEEIEGRLEGQIKGFLGSFSGLAVDRMIGYVLAEEHRPGFRKAQRRVGEHLLDRSVSSLLPAPEVTARWRDAVWDLLRTAEPEDEEERLARLYADFGSETLGAWLWDLHPATRDLLALRLGDFLATRPA